MKNITIIFLLVVNFSVAQIGFNTLNPSVTLAIGQDDLGINSIGENHLVLVTNGLPRFNIPNTGFIGINQTNPSYRLDVDGHIKIQNLINSTANSISYLAIDNNGVVGKKSSIFAIGQVMRVGIIGKDYNTGSEQTLELFYTDANDDQYKAPNDAPNYFNDIPSASIAISPTHEISLPSGTYSINLKLIGAFYSSNEDNRVAVKMYVGENTTAEHSFVSSLLYGTGQGVGNGHQNARKMGNFSEVLIVPSGKTYKIQFKLEPFNSNINIIQGFIPVGSDPKVSLRSLVTISRISE